MKSEFAGGAGVTPVHRRDCADRPLASAGAWRSLSVAPFAVRGAPHCPRSQALGRDPRLPPPCPQTRRSAFQCLQKYQQHNAALKRREWTQEEDRMLTQLVQAMGVGSHIPYRRSESWGSSRAAREPVAWGRLTRRGLCLQSPTTWRGGTPRSSSTAGPKAWTPP